MGFFIDDPETDLEILTSILEGFAAYWNGLPAADSCSLLLSVNASILEKIQEYANEAFSRFYEQPSYCQRIAAFLILGTACPCLSLTDRGKPVTDKNKRQWFFSRVNLMIVPAIFHRLRLRDHKAPQWPGYPADAILQQIAAFLELVDHSDLIEPRTHAHSIKGLAKDIAALSIIIQMWMENPVNPNQDGDSIMRGVGLIE